MNFQHLVELYQKSLKEGNGAKRSYEAHFNDVSKETTTSGTKETELQGQKIINLQNVINNLTDTFTDYKGVTKPWNLVVNTSKRMEVPKKTIHASSVMKRGRATF
jgi:hypothetical protein